MMNISPFHVTSFAIGCGIAVVILVLVRRNHLMVSHSIWWIAVALTGIVLGVYPRLIDRISGLLGVNYAPTLLLSVCVALILVKMLTMELGQAEQERKIRRLAQRMAVLEKELVEPCQPDSIGNSGCKKEE